MRASGAVPLLLVIATILSACGGRDEVTVEEHLVLTLRHDHRALIPAGAQAQLELEVTGSIQPAPGSVRMWWYAAGDTGWAAIPARPGPEDRWSAPVPPGPRGQRAAYLWEATTPSGQQLLLPADLSESRRPYRTVRAGEYPGLLHLLTLAAFAAAGLALLGAALLGLRTLQSAGEPLPTEQGRLARWTASGALLLGTGALLGMIAAMFLWGVPYRGFPLGGYLPHTKVLLLLLLWGGMTWASWGSLRRSPGSRDLFPPRVQASMVLGAALLSVLIVLLPAGGPEMALPALPITG